MFWDHLFQYPDQIRDLIAMRREADLHARSNIVINIAEADVYIATIDDKCAPVSIFDIGLLLYNIGVVRPSATSRTANVYSVTRGKPVTRAQPVDQAVSVLAGSR